MLFNQREFEEFEDECRMICDQNNLYVNTGNMTPNEWALITFVNANYPTIKNRDSMREVAYLWCFYGLGIFKAMSDDAGAYYRLNLEIRHASGLDWR